MGIYLTSHGPTSYYVRQQLVTFEYTDSITTPHPAISYNSMDHCKDKTLASTPFTTMPATLSDLRQNSDLWHRVLVLLYDLDNLAKDPESEKRLSSTTHVLYISEPYFTQDEATAILNATIHRSSGHPSANDAIGDREPGISQTRPPYPCKPSGHTTIEQGINERLSNFPSNEEPVETLGRAVLMICFLSTLVCLA